MKNHAKLNVIVGTPGTGKSYRLVNKVIEQFKNKKSIYVMAPTYTAKERIIVGYKERLDNHVITDIQYRQLCRDTHVLQYSYKNEEIIFIDEFSMLDISDWYSLLFRVEGEMRKKQINIYLNSYGDVKQLPPVKNNGTLGVLLRVNYNKFNHDRDKEFSEFVAKDLYKNIDKEELQPPKDWNGVIDQVNLKVLHTNYRLASNYDNIADYDEDFYDYVFSNNVLELEDDAKYCDSIANMIKEKYLIIVPTHNIGQIIDNYMKNNLTSEELQSTAPFLRKDSKIYKNPYCDIDYKFDFVTNVPEEYDTLVDKYKYSFYSTVHSCQGATVDNVAFVTMNYRVNPHVKDFYSNNMLYTALSRARKNSYFLGDGSIFQFMRENYSKLNTTSFNSKIQRDAAKKTYNTLKDKYPQEKLTYQQVIDLYKTKFTEAINEDSGVIDTAMTIDNKFRPKLLSDNDIMAILNKRSKNKKVGYHIDEPWYNEQYRLWFNNVKIRRSARAGKIGGKHSSVGEWLDSLSDDELNKVIADMYLSRRKFATKYHHDKRSVKRLLN